MKQRITISILLVLSSLFSILYGQSLMIANFEDGQTDLMCNKRFITLDLNGEKGNPFEIVDNPYKDGNNTSGKVMKISPVYKSGGFRLNLSANISSKDPRITDGKSYEALRLKYRVNDPEKYPVLNAGLRINSEEASAAKARWYEKEEDWKTALFIFTTYPKGSMTYIEIEPFKEIWTGYNVPVEGLEIYIDDIELVRFEPVELMVVADFENKGTDKMTPERFGTVGGGSPLTIVENPYKSEDNNSDYVMKISDIVQFAGFHLNMTRNITNEDDKINNTSHYTGIRLKYRVNNPEQFPSLNAGININGMTEYTAAAVWADTDKDWKRAVFTFDQLPESVANIQFQLYKAKWSASGSPIEGLEIYIDDVELFIMPDFSEGLLNTITVNGKELDFFVPETKEYQHYLPYTTTQVPLVAFTPSNQEQEVNITPAVNLNGTAEERTTVLTITENGEETAQYKITFTVLPRLDIYICLGQSNMSGYGEIAEEDKGVIDNTFLLTPGTNFEPAEVPLNKYSTISNGSYAKINPAYGFAKALIGETENPVGLLVNARNGSSIADWKKGNNSTKLYANTVERTLEAKKWGTIKGILWHQGESDSWQATAYPNLLKAWVNDFRTDIGDSNNQVYFVAGELAYWRHDNGVNKSDAFNKMIRTIATFVPNSNWISAEGLTPWKDDTDPHFDRASNIILGERYAEKMIEKFYSGSVSVKEYDNNNTVQYELKGRELKILSETHSNIIIYDMYGKVLHHAVFTGEYVYTIPVIGIYLLQLTNEKGSFIQKVLVK